MLYPGKQIHSLVTARDPSGSSFSSIKRLISKNQTFKQHNKMKRIPEPEIMDGREQVEAYAKADFSESNQLFVNLFLKYFPEVEPGNILDIGCGPGDIPIRMCRALSKIKITAIDASKPMLDIAEKLIQETGFDDRINLFCDRLPKMSFKGKFDAIISKDLLHHLNDPESLWSVIKKYGKKNTSILIMDLFRPDSIREVEEMVKSTGASDSKICDDDFHNSLLAAYTTEEVKEQLQTSNLGYLNLEVVNNRHFIVWGRI